MKEIVYIDDVGEPPTPEQIEKMKAFLEKCPKMSVFSSPFHYKGELLEYRTRIKI